MTPEEWIEVNVKYPHGACLFYAVVVAALYYPRFKLVRGQHSAQGPRDSCHYWLEDDEGSILDPTERQYPFGGYYFDPLEVDILPHIRYVFVNRSLSLLWNELPQKDRQQLVDDWWFLAVEWGQEDAPRPPSNVYEVTEEEWRRFIDS